MRLETMIENTMRATLATLAVSALLMCPAAFGAPPTPCAAGACGTPAAPTRPVSVASDVPDTLGAAAENGDVDAMNLLGVLLVANAREPSDHSLALYWFRRAVDAGSADGMYNVATMYLRGFGVARDYANAFHWFSRAMDQGHPYAAYSAAAMSEHGLGCTRDLPRARRLYRRAAEAGVPLAMWWLSEDLARPGEHRDPVEAYAWLEVLALTELDGQLQVVLLGRMEALGAQLATDQRDRAHSKAAHIVADIRTHAAREAEQRASRAAPRRSPSSV